MSDRRASIRHLCNFDVSFSPDSSGNEERWEATVCDISLEGMGLIVRKPLPLGLEIGVDLDSAEAGLSYTMCARVLRLAPLSDGTWRAGCAFLRALSEEELRSLL
jgi:hypothetical protein